jgi:hypothetical protein
MDLLLVARGSDTPSTPFAFTDNVDEKLFLLDLDYSGVKSGANGKGITLNLARSNVEGFRYAYKSIKDVRPLRILPGGDFIGRVRLPFALVQRMMQMPNGGEVAMLEYPVLSMRDLNAEIGHVQLQIKWVPNDPELTPRRSNIRSDMADRINELEDNRQGFGREPSAFDEFEGKSGDKRKSGGDNSRGANSAFDEFEGVSTSKPKSSSSGVPSFNKKASAFDEFEGGAQDSEIMPKFKKKSSNSSSHSRSHSSSNSSMPKFKKKPSAFDEFEEPQASSGSTRGGKNKKKENDLDAMIDEFGF